MKINVYDKKGEKKKDLDVKSKVFNSEPKEAILKEVVLATLAGKRSAHPKTKKVGEVQGSGRKPWKQKGTGRARTGSVRNPIWRGGGNIFGPVGNENHTRKVNSKVKKKALFMALTSKNKANEIIVLEDITQKAPKTKEVAEIFAKLPLSDKKLVVLPDESEVLRKSVRNIKGTKVLSYKALNTYEVMRARNIVFFGDSLEKTVEYFGKEKAKKSEEKPKDKKEDK